MAKILAILKKKKRYIHISITLLLALLFVSLLTAKVRSDQIAWSEDVDRNTIAAGVQSGYDVLQNENGTVTYIPIGDDPQLYVMLDGETFNQVTLRLTEPLSQALHIQFYFEEEHQGLTEGDSRHCDLKAGDTSVTLSIPEKSYTMIRVDADGRFSPDGMTLEWMPLERYYAVNWLALILLVVFTALLVVFDRKIGYVSSVLAFFCASLEKLKTERQQYGKFRAALYGGMWISTALYVAAMAVLLLLSHLSVGAVYMMFALGVLAVALQLAYRCVSGKGNEPAKLFLIVTLLLGITFAYCLPITSGVTWDDQIHYQRAQNISSLLLGHDESFADYDLKASPQLFSKSLKSLDDVNTSLLLNSQTDTGAGATLFDFYTNIPYFHMAAVIALRGFLGIDFILQVTLIKMANVLLYATVLYFGIKKLKSGGYLLSAICLMPTALFLASTINYDFWVTAFLGYAMATFISELQTPERPLSLATTVKMLLAIVLGCAAKAVYFVLFLPVLLLGKHKFTDGSRRKKYVLVCCLVLALILMSFALPFLLNTGSQTDVRGGADVDAGKQLSYILHNPLKYAKTLLYFMADYMSFGQANNYVSFYAYMANPIQICSTAAILIILFCAFVDKGECDCFEKAGLYKLMMVVCGFASIAVVATSLYIAYTPVAANTVLGCQWRYIVPVMFPLLYSIGTPKLTCHLGDRKMGAVVFGVLAFVLAASFFDVYIASLSIA